MSIEIENCGECGEDITGKMGCPISHTDRELSERRQSTVIDTPGAINTWHFLSRMHQLAIELNTGMKHSKGPILANMYREGLIDVNLRGTRANKIAVLAMMVETMTAADPTYTPSAGIARALKS